MLTDNTENSVMSDENDKHPTNEKVTSGNDSDEDDAEKRLARSRERNREHARRTRVRKKAQLEALQARVKELQGKNRLLKQSVEECSIASILLGLSSGGQAPTTDGLIDSALCVTSSTTSIPLVMSGKRKRFISEELADHLPQPLKLEIDGQITLIGGGKTHINWKTGVYSDENGAQRQLTQEQLENLRRERNRMHAKMTRDRKKYFIASVQRTITQLENENNRLSEALAKQSLQRAKASNVVVSPVVLSNPSSSISVSSVSSAVSVNSATEISLVSTPAESPVFTRETSVERSNEQQGPRKSSHPRVPHGFTVVA
mmetsp:Transcript_8648/g.13379  ORF Transcript_8648/g.13379 Transcript_8648/m.13379 type:complete len:316 (+) Transcript_8648:312-1259(+)|eukprot:CAMPEP_0118687330 /NCGR_PEP_ID=MMETSP0800-20121206/8319_1 /TAXON_ID=210618 ORGANISM="Striatella unipunctata, Strain CCMP2910" /NCGR_SAMPLE_ID=MMETSP0800 /ASSEMBLY_ACC=CAM_ASM_000638 /LENGTH=315 /DNA_ID=CAMNT_0006584495 /DNA_START=187 /DNA_END=1134 /DNA_ORIENTATION=+